MDIKSQEYKILKAHARHAKGKRCKKEHETLDGICINCGFRPDRER